MSNNQLNDISRVYLAQVAEETPGERIDRISQANVAKRKAKADSEKQARDKKTAEFQKHKNAVLAKGGRHVDALDSWHSKEAYERNATLREEVKCGKKGKKSTKSSVAPDPVENDQVIDQFGGMMSSESKEDRLHKNRKISIKMGSAAQELAKREKDDDAFGAPKAKKVKKEAFSDWRNDLSEGPLTSSPSLASDHKSEAPANIHRITQDQFEKEVTEKKVKNKVIINPTFQESIREIGGEVLDAVEIDEVKVTRLDDKKKKEDRDKKVKAMLARQAEWENAKKKALHASHEPEGENLDEKDSYKTVAAVIDYDRSKKGTDDATYDSEHGEKKKAKKERDYAAWEREKMKRDDPNWKHKKGSTSESVEVDEYIETVQKVKKAEAESDLKRWSVEEGKCDNCGCKGCGENPCVECGEDHHKLDEAVKGEDTQTRKDSAAERRKGVGKLLSKKEGERNADKMERDVKFYAKLTKKGRVDEQLDDKKKEDPLKKRGDLIKKQVLLKKLQALRTGGDGITASYEPEGDMVEMWKPDPVEKRKKKAADLYRREKIAQGTSAKYKTDKTEDPDKLYKRRMAVDSKTKMKEEVVDEAKVDAGKTPHEKETIRNQRNTPPGANTKFDTSVFITRKSGESPTSARGRKRREAHAAKRGVKQEGYQRNPEKGEAEERKAEKSRKESGRMPPRGDKRREDFEKWYASMREDKAFDNVVGMLRKKHGESGVLTKDSPKPKAQSQPKKKPEKNTRSEVDAQYGRTAWNKKGSLGT